MLTIESRMVIIFWVGSPFLFEHVSYWYLLLEPHLTTYDSNIRTWIREAIEIGTSTLLGCDLTHDICRGWYQMGIIICHDMFIYSYSFATCIILGQQYLHLLPRWFIFDTRSNWDILPRSTQHILHMATSVVLMLDKQVIGYKYLKLPCLCKQEFAYNCSHFEMLL